MIVTLQAVYPFVSVTRLERCYAMKSEKDRNRQKKPTGKKAFDFVWHVNESGYQWVRAAKIESETGARMSVDWCLVARPVPGSMVKPQRPLEEHTGLFRDFSQLELKRDAILRFADQHGPLFGPLSTVVPASARTLITGERFADWKLAVTEMATLSELWRASAERDVEALRRFIFWKEEHVYYKIPGGRMAVIASSKFDTEKWASLQREDLVLPARLALQSELDERLSSRSRHLLIGPRLIWTTNTDLQLVLQPSSLLAAMWLQFAQAVAGNYQLRVCEGCGGDFFGGGGARKRVDARAHNNTCRPPG